MGFLDKFKTKPAPVLVPQTAPPPMDEDHFTPRLTFPDTRLQGPHVYAIPMTDVASQTISHKGLAIDWSVFGPWIGDPTDKPKPVRRKFWIIPVDDGTVEFWVPRKIQIGYSRGEQGQQIHTAIKILEEYVDGPLRVESFGYIAVNWNERDDDGNPTWKGKLSMARPHQGWYGTWKPVKSV